MEKNTPTQLIQGVYRDPTKVKSKDDSVWFALNAIREDFTGDIGSYSNEPGNTLCFSGPSGYSIIGHKVLNRKETLVLLVNPTINKSEIGIVTRGCRYEALIKSSELGFSVFHQIKVEHRVMRGCQRIVYLYDGLNPDRRIDLDRLTLYTSNNETAEQANTNDSWNVNAMSLIPRVTEPHIAPEVIDSGGFLELGIYKFYVETLDASFNTVGVSNISDGIPIYDESRSSPYPLIDGGYNFNDTIIGNDGFVPKANKSILLRVSNLDQDHSYFRVNVVRYISGDGSTVEVFQKGDIIPISPDNNTYVFGGISTENGDIRKNIQEVQIAQQVYEISKGMQQVDNRLVRINVKTQTDIDFGKLQQAALLITSRYFTREVSKEDIGELSPKNPQAYIDARNHMRDEVYAYGVSGKLLNGERLPTFHIPGRASITDTALITLGNLFSDGTGLHTRNVVPVGENWDTQLLDVVDVITDATTQILVEDVKHLGFTSANFAGFQLIAPVTSTTPDGLYPAGTVPRWMAHNTAIQGGIPSDERFVRQGDLAYYQSNTNLYPDVPLPDDSKLFGSLTGTPIRHHKMPDATLDKHTEGDNVYPIGIRFNLQPFFAALPQELIDAVASWEIVRVKRTEFNKTILDKGIISFLRLFNDIPAGETVWTVSHEAPGFADMMNPNQLVENTQHQVFLSPRTQFRNDYFNQSYKIEGIFENEGIADDGDVGGQNASQNSNDYEFSGPMAFGRWDDYVTQNLEGVNRNINSAVYVQPRSQQRAVQQFNQPIRNRYSDINLLHTKTDDDFASVNQGYDVSDRRFYYVGMKSQRNVYNNLFNLIYYPVYTLQPEDNNLAYVFNGDTFISRLSFHVSRKGQNNDEDTGGMRFLHKGFWIESEINTDLRHGGIGEGTSYYQEGDEFQFLADLSVFNDEDDVVDVYENYFKYNEDFSVVSCEVPFVPLPITFDYESNCLTEAKNKMIWSEVSFPQELADGFRIYKTNNEREMGESSGELTNIYYDQNKLLVTTEEGMFLLSPNPRQLQSDIDVIHLGTGDFLSISPNQFLKTDYGYAGNQGRFNSTVTEFGYVTIDQNQGEIHIYRDGLKKLSDEGLTNWFKENLPSFLLEQIESAGGTYAYPDNTASTKGIGIQSVYDPRYKRFILHKTDFQAIPELWDGVAILESDVEFGKLYINGAGTIFYTRTVDGIEVVDLGDPDYFINRSWTISYEFKYQSWTGWHSYQPSYMYNDADTFYTVNYDNSVWKHGDRNFNSFYGIKYPTVIEYIVKNPMTEDFHALHWYSTTKQWDTGNHAWIDKPKVTFDQMLIYNTSQSTGLQDLTYVDEQINPYGNRVGWDNQEKDVILTEKDYKVASIRDLAIDQPVNTSSWGNLIYRNHFNQSTSDRQGYIDLVPLDASLDYNMNQHNLADMKDKFHNVRLYFNPDTDDDFKIILDIVNSKTFISAH